MFVFGSAIAGFAMVGCAGGAPSSEEEGSGGHSGAGVTVVQSALTSCQPCSATAYSAITVTDGETLLGPSLDTHLCWPGRYDAPNISTAPFLVVRRDINGTNNWTVTGRGRAECVTKCCFNSNGGSQDVRWQSEDFVAAASASSGSATASTAMWESDAMGILSGVYHTDDFTPGGMKPNTSVFTEYASMTMRSIVSQPAFIASKVKATPGHTFPPAMTVAHGYSFFVGTPHTGHIVKTNGFVTQTGIGIKTLIPYSDGICILQGVAGVGKNAVPRVYRSNGDWLLRIEGTDNTASADARCYYFNQNQ